MSGVEEYLVGAFVSRRPRILLAGLPGPSSRHPIGFAGTEAYHAAEGRGIVLFGPMWTMHRADYRNAVQQGLRELRRARPEDLLVMLMNDDGEEKFMKDVAVDQYYYVHKSCFTDIGVFAIDNRSVHRRFDAIYNARADAYKRHNLCADIASLGLICTDLMPNGRDTLREILPAATILNEQPGGALARLTPAEVSARLDEAGCGLALSRIEGQNWATIEYLAKGLPVVTTPNAGGRNRSLTPQNSIICKPTPAAVAEAVRFALTFDRDARAHIAEDARRQIEAEQRYFRHILARILAEFGEGGAAADIAIPHKGPSKGNPMSHFLAFLGPEREAGTGATASAAGSWGTEARNMAGGETRTENVAAAALRPILATVRSDPWGALSRMKQLMAAGRRADAAAIGAELARRVPGFAAAWPVRLGLSERTRAFPEACAAVAREMAAQSVLDRDWLLRPLLDCVLHVPPELGEGLLARGRAGGIVNEPLAREAGRAAGLVAAATAELRAGYGAQPAARNWCIGVFGGNQATVRIGDTIGIDLGRLDVRDLPSWDTHLGPALMAALHVAVGLLPVLDDTGVHSWGRARPDGALAAIVWRRLRVYAAEYRAPGEHRLPFAPAGLGAGELWVRAGNVELWALWSHLREPEHAAAAAEEVAARAAAGGAGDAFPATDAWWPRVSAVANITRLATNAGWHARPGFAGGAFADWAERYRAALAAGGIVTGATEEILRVAALAPDIARRPPAEWSDEAIVRRLSGARVVAVTACDEEVEAQFRGGALAAIWAARGFDNPPRSLRALPAPMTIWPYATGDSWSHDFAELCERSARAIVEDDADVFLASCGAYGLPLVHEMHRRFGIACVYYGHAMNMYLGVFTNAFRDLRFFRMVADAERWLPSDLAARYPLVARVDNGRYVVEDPDWRTTIAR
ncbi:MAG: glycosyltransferase [Alphaproteobacteria bacterium]